LYSSQKGEKMSRKRKKINYKLLELGQKLGLDKNEVRSSKRNIKNILSIAIAIGIFTIIGLIFTSRLDIVGEFYMPPSIRDFNILGRLL
jgi:hypothetical protein